MIFHNAYFSIQDLQCKLQGSAKLGLYLCQCGARGTNDVSTVLIYLYKIHVNAIYEMTENNTMIKQKVYMSNIFQ